MDFSQQVVVITGAGNGIGLGIAHAIYREECPGGGCRN